MSANVIPFVYNDKPVRSVQREGEPWFVGRDVCAVLDIRNESQALARLDDDEREAGVCIADPSGTKFAIIISEAGVYRLVFSSRKKEAEDFKRWLAHEVLPKLRRTGRFALPERATPVEAVPEAADMMMDEPLQRWNLKLAMIREARIVHGNAMAKRLWSELGLPAGESAPQRSLAEARACLRQLLSAKLPGGCHIEDAIVCQWDDIRRFARDLQQAGVRVEGNMLWVANNSAFLKTVYAGTEWDGEWRLALLALPGATVAGARKLGTVQASAEGPSTARGVHVPLMHLDLSVDPPPR